MQQQFKVSSTRNSLYSSLKAGENGSHVTASTAMQSVRTESFVGSPRISAKCPQLAAF